jgi:hypothetical protein
MTLRERAEARHSCSICRQPFEMTDVVMHRRCAHDHSDDECAQTLRAMDAELTDLRRRLAALERCAQLLRDAPRKPQGTAPWWDAQRIALAALDALPSCGASPTVTPQVCIGGLKGS